MIIETISWQWLYAIHLLVAYELIMTTKDAPASSWLSVEVVFGVVWLLKGCWNLDSPLYKSTEQQEGIFVLMEGDHPFVTITMMHGSVENPPQNLPSESSCRQVLAANSHPAGSFTQLLYFDSGDGTGSPQEHLHSLGLNCFVHPCHGVCQFRPAGATPGQSLRPHSANEDDLGYRHYFDPGYATHSMNAGLASGTAPDERLNDDLQMSESSPVTDDDQIIIDGLLSLGARTLPEEGGISCSVVCFTGPMGISASSCLTPVATTHCQQSLSDHKKKYDTEQKICDLIVFREDGQQRPCGKLFKNANSLSSHKSRIHSGQKTCDVILVEEDGRQRVCGKVCRNAHALSDHKSRDHSVQQACDFIVVGKGGRRQPCGKVCKSGRALSRHKGVEHTRQQACGTTVVGEDGQQRPCGKLFKNTNSLSSHKSRIHSGQKTCDVILVGEDGQQRPCGKVCRNAHALSDHKSRDHCVQKNCDLIVVGEDGRQQPCGKVCKSGHALSDHKRAEHTRQQACGATTVGKNGQQRPCRKVCKNARALSDHMRKNHSGPQTCEVTVVGENGQQRPCKQACKNLQAFLNHKRRHRKRKLDDMDRNNDLSPQEVK